MNGTLTITIAAQTITFPQPADMVFGSGPITLNATASSGLPVTYVVSGPAMLNGSILTMSGVGTVTVVASQGGNIDFAPAASIGRSLNVTPASQTIAFNTIPPQLVGSVTLLASASSGLPVSFNSSTSTVCTVSGTAASLLAPGTCTIQASQAGNGDYRAATPVTQSFKVSAASTAGFTITPEPSSEVVPRGNLAGFVLDIKSLNGFKGTVKLTCADGPAGATSVDFPRTVYLNKELFAVAGILFPRNSKVATYIITFTGTSGSLVTTMTSTLTIK